MQVSRGASLIHSAGRSPSGIKLKDNGAREIEGAKFKEKSVRKVNTGTRHVGSRFYSYL